ncbi:Dabb family protein [Rhodococcus sp. NPDC127528]|uniref:Dabb family protein n=1 Tax=unclassified Rhodococcus (in: high G+C Gram-positive bacteria) TaxID=192944 RepID=UPI00363F49F3
MFKVTKLIHFREDVDHAARSRFAERLRGACDAAGARRTLVEPTLAGVRNGGDLIAHLQFDDDRRWRSAESGVVAAVDPAVVAHVDGVEYVGEAAGGTESGAVGGVYRTLLLRVSPEASAAVVERFEADLLRMPRYLPSMRAWQLSRVRRAEGASPWTHVWEQEFADLDALTGSYLAHPVHWAHVDRWFDPECPDIIVRDRVCHSFCALDQPVV